MKPSYQKIGFIGLIVLAIFYFSTSEIVDTPKTTPEQKIVANEELKRSAIPADHNVFACEERTHIFSLGKNFVALDSKLIDEKLELAYSNPKQVIEEASKSPASALALFRLISACFPNFDNSDAPQKNNNGCPVLEIGKIIKFHPIEILERQAELGSIDAKIQFAMSAPLAARQLKKIGNVESYDFSIHILDLGKRYAEDAAKAGSEDAMRYVSRAYATGMFGVRNIQQAYIYALPLSFSGAENDLKLISDLGSKLTNEQRRAAQILSLGCESTRDKESLRSPFG